MLKTNDKYNKMTSSSQKTYVTISLHSMSKLWPTVNAKTLIMLNTAM